MTKVLKFPRILLKLSGEALLGKEPYGVSHEACLNTAKTLKSIVQQGHQLAVVMGGGNIFRGMKGVATGMARTPADQLGMLATIMNGVALLQALKEVDCPARVLSALDIPKVAESFVWHRAVKYLSEGEVVLCCGGTGNPYFTTDTAAALRAAELEANILLKATKVDGVYNEDPMRHPNAVKYNQIAYSQMLAQNLEVIDATAITLCMKSKIPIFVCNMAQLPSQPIDELVGNQKLGTMITG